MLDAGLVKLNLPDSFFGTSIGFPRGIIDSSEVADSSSRVRVFSTLFFSTPTTPMSQQLWLRCEKKEFERRAALSPKIAKSLIDAGFLIHVERDEQRIFDDSEYESCAYLR